MCMNQENKNKIAIIGHTKGIGKAIADLYKKKKYQVIGLSSSNGYDLQCSQVEIMEQLDDCPLVVINAYVGGGQMTLLKRIYGKYLFENKKVAAWKKTTDAGLNMISLQVTDRTQVTPKDSTDIDDVIPF